MMASDPDLVIALLTGLAAWSLRAIALGGLVALALAVARVTRARAQLTSWTVVLIAALAMPALTVVVPAIHWVVPILSVVVPAPASTPDPALRVAAGNQDARAAGNRVDLSPLPLGDSEPTPQRAHASVSPSGGATISNPASATRWPLLIGALYVIVVAILLTRLLVGARATRRLLRTATPIDDVDALERLRHHAEALGLPRAPALVAADALAVPITTGIANPVLLLPPSWREWTEMTRDAVFRHELSHVARRDTLTQRLSLIHRAICWFSPFSWWLSARLSQLAEYASDEAVLDSGVERETYSEILVGFLAATQQKDGLVDWQIAMARRTGAEQRIARILDWRGARRIATSALVATALFVAAAAGLVAAVRPIAPTVTVPAEAVTVPAAVILPAVAPPTISSASTFIAALPPAAPGSRPLAGGTAPESTAFSGASPGPSSQQIRPAPGEGLAGFRLTVLLFELTGGLQASSAQASVSPPTPPAEDMRKAIDAALKWVSEEMAPTDLVAVASIGTRLDVQADFTRDPADVRAALDAVASAVQAASTTGGGPIAPSQVSSDVRLRAMKTLCETLAPISQKKTVRYFSNGLQASNDSAAVLRDAAQTCNRANTSIVPIDVRGLPPPAPSTNPAPQAAAPAQATATGRPIFTTTVQTVLVELAVRDSTGAFVPGLGPEAFRVLEDGIEQRIAFVIPAMSSPGPERPMPYYVLSYSSNREEAAGASRFRPISVRGSHPDLQIDHRAGYYAGSRAVPDGPSTATAPVAGRDATNPVLIAAKKPDYPPSAILRRLQGRVELEAVVLGDGSVGDVRVTTSLEPGLDQQAIQAAKQWRFNPATSKGIPVSMPVTVVMNFMLR